jgi:hypothetical protein
VQTHSDAVSLGATGGRNRWWRLPAIVFAASAILMLAATRGDLAIDEVVSLDNAVGARSWLDIVTQNQNDNTHLLNTCFLRLLGDHQPLFVYRIPAAIFGIGLVALLTLVSCRYGKDTALWTVCLAGLSYPVILYGSEARGYAAVMFFAVAAFELLLRCHERCTAPRLILFWTVLMLGFLAHFSFIMVCVALGIWTLIRDRLAGVSLRGSLVNAAKYFGPVMIFLAGLYLVYIRHMTVLGGAAQSRGAAIAETASYLLGFVNETGLGGVSEPLGLALVVAGVWVLYRQKRDEWIFFALVLLVTPAMVLVCWHSSFLYYRYFSACFPFFYLLLAILFAHWFRGHTLKIVPVLLLVAITAGHLVKTASLLRYGRGNYRQALRDMAAATPGPIIKVGSDNDFRNGTLLGFYAQFLPRSKQIEYVPQARRNEEKPDWIIVHCFNTSFIPYPDVEVGHLGKYVLFATYPYCGSSGWAWFVYRRPAAAAP